jgi:putative DNA primase/helicase
MAASCSESEVREALAYISPNQGHEDWFKIAAAVKNGLGEDGFDLFDQWSQSGESYKAQDVLATWRSTQVNGSGKSITIGTLYKLAQDNGYQPAANLNKLISKPARPIVMGSAQDYWDRAEPCTRHPYADKKGLDISGDGLKKYKGRLLIPAFNADDEISSIQRIDKDGIKKFLQGCTMSGCRYTLTGDDVLVVAEGWATAKSIHLATGHTAIVAFSSGGFTKVPPLLRHQNPEARIILAPDNDESQDAVRKATKAARKSNCEIIVPAVTNGTDFNDIHQAAGLDEVRRQFVENPNRPLLHDCNVVALADVKPEPIRWLWRDRIPLGMFSLLAGQPGVGKTTIAMSITAIVTRGGTWPFSQDRALQGRVVILTAEDDPKYTLVPRLMAAGADLTRVIVVQSVMRPLEDGHTVDTPLLLSEDMHQLHGVMEQYNDTRLMIFDPLSAYLGVKDSHRDADVRQVLGPLTELAGRHGVAVLGITHLSKNAANSAMARFMGSTGIIAASRAAFLATRHEDELMLLPVKNNLAPIDTGGLTYWIKGATVGDGITTSCIEWTGQTDIDADKALSQQQSLVRSPKLVEAMDFLEEQLKDGPKRQPEIEQEATECGISWATVRRARAELKIMSNKDRFSGGWKWYTKEQFDQKQEQENA